MSTSGSEYPNRPTTQTLARLHEKDTCTGVDRAPGRGRNAGTRTAVLIAACILGYAGHATAQIVTKAHPGADCVSHTAGLTPGSYYGGASNQSTAVNMDLHCPYAHDTLKSSISSGSVVVADNSTTEDVVCTLRSIVFDVNASTFRSHSETRRSSSFETGRNQLLVFSQRMPKYPLGHVLYDCRLPKATSRGPSYVLTYRALEN